MEGASQDLKRPRAALDGASVDIDHSPAPPDGTECFPEPATKRTRAETSQTRSGQAAASALLDLVQSGPYFTAIARCLTAQDLASLASCSSQTLAAVLGVAGATLSVADANSALLRILALRGDQLRHLSATASRLGGAGALDEVAAGGAAVLLQNKPTAGEIDIDGLRSWEIGVAPGDVGALLGACERLGRSADGASVAGDAYAMLDGVRAAVGPHTPLPVVRLRAYLPRALPQLPQLVALTIDNLGRPDAFSFLDAAGRLLTPNLRRLTVRGWRCPALPGDLPLEYLEIEGGDSAAGDASCSAPGSSWLPRSSARRLRTLKLEQVQVTRLPEDAPLEDVVVEDCKVLEEGPEWLPPSSVQRLRRIRVAYSTVSEIPPDCVSLEEIHLDGCPRLRAAWLPESSAQKVHTVRATKSSVARVPPAMQCLRELVLNGCAVLGNDEAQWIPLSSVQNLRRLEIAHTSVTCLPGCAAHLETLNVSHCEFLAADDTWLPLSSAGSLRSLVACHSSIRKIPEDMPLIQLDLQGCKNLADVHEAIPASSVRTLERLTISGTLLEAVPAAATRLQQLDVTQCLWLDREHWLPEPVRASLELLVVSLTRLERLPPGLTRLQVLGAKYADLSAHDWLPPSSCGSLKSIDLSDAVVRALPDHLPPLDFLDVSSARRVVLPAQLRVKILRARNHSVWKVLPDGLAGVEVLDVSHCRMDGRVPGGREEWIPGGCRTTLRRLVARASELTRLPVLPRLEHVDARECPKLVAVGPRGAHSESGWLPDGCGAETGRPVEVLRDLV
ncbi:unnamed protein product [Pedinophyceae sp. YPF-701]|nr:unnamed protein product [Pedinophyceae sp. YPF-701]